MAEETGFTTEAFPTQGGVYSAWVPEYQSGNTDLSADGWRPVPMVRSERGVPGELYSEPMNAQIGMCSFAQANAIAWSYAAEHAHHTGRSGEIRVVQYRVKYDIKCYRAAPPQQSPAATPERKEGGNP